MPEREFVLLRVLLQQIGNVVVRRRSLGLDRQHDGGNAGQHTDDHQHRRSNSSRATLTAADRGSGFLSQPSPE